jgi:uncharacterized membrane protein YccF (DUF307 family)
MKVVRFVLKFIVFTVWLVLALAWLVFFGAFGVACFASVLFIPVGVASFGLALMPLMVALSWMGWHHSPTSVTVNVNR